MSDRNADFYVQDVDFGSAYNPMQAPFHLSYVAATQGFAPLFDPEDLTYCDLGCGNGMTLNGLAAAHPSSRFIGIDFNAQHIEQARQLARAAGLGNVEFHEASFEALERLDLPQFDFVAMNGIYSWLHPKLVASAIDFLELHLKSGGLFVVEYLTQPGSASVAPMWNLMRAITSHVEGSPVERAAGGLEALVKLRQNNARYFTANPRQAGHIDQMDAQNARDDRILNWVAHASLADNWHPKYFTEVADELGRAQLGYVGSVNLSQNDLGVVIPPKLREMFDELKDAGQIELLKDFILDQSQRTDVFSKDAAPDPEGARRFLSERVHLLPVTGLDEALCGLSRMGRQVYGPDKTLYKRMIELIHAAGRTLSLGEIVSDPQLAESDLETRWQALARIVLTSHYQLGESARSFPVPEGTDRRWKLPLDYNRIMLEQSLTQLERSSLVCGSGAGVPLHGIDALFLWVQLERDEADRVAEIRSRLAGHDGLILIDGQPTSPDWITDIQIEDGLDQFQRIRLPVLAKLGVIEPEKSPANGD